MRPRLGDGLFYRDQAVLRSGKCRAGRPAAPFSQSDDAPSKLATGGYNRLRAELSHTFKVTPAGTMQPELIVGVKGLNLLGDVVRNHASCKTDEVLQPGQNVRA